MSSLYYGKDTSSRIDGKCLIYSMLKKVFGKCFFLFLWKALSFTMENSSKTTGFIGIQ